MNKDNALYLFTIQKRLKNEPVHSLNVFEWQKDIIYSPYSHQNMFSTNLNKCLISLQILVPFGRRPLEMVCGSGIKTDKLAIDRA